MKQSKVNKNPYSTKPNYGGTREKTLMQANGESGKRIKNLLKNLKKA
jgi:hypothetical protein